MIYWFSRLDKIEKATINPKIDNDTCFQYAATVALSYEKIKRNPEIILNIKLLIDKYNWQKINYPSKIDDWKTFEQNNPTIALNILHTKEKEITPAYIILNQWKTNNSLNDSKRRKGRMTLSWSKKIICIIKNITLWWFILLELSSFF